MEKLFRWASSIIHTLKPKVSHSIKWKKAINTRWKELPCFKTHFKDIFTTRRLLWEVISSWLKDLLLFQVHLLLVCPDLSYLSLKQIYVPGRQEIHKVRLLSEKTEVKGRKNERGRKNCDRAQTEEKSVMCESIFHNQGCALWFGEWRGSRGEKKGAECVSDSLRAKKASENSSKVTNVTSVLVWESPLDVS